MSSAALLSSWIVASRALASAARASRSAACEAARLAAAMAAWMLSRLSNRLAATDAARPPPPRRADSRPYPAARAACSRSRRSTGTPPRTPSAWPSTGGTASPLRRPSWRPASPCIRGCLAGDVRQAIRVRSIGRYDPGRRRCALGRRERHARDSEPNGARDRLPFALELRPVGPILGETAGAAPIGLPRAVMPSIGRAPHRHNPASRFRALLQARMSMRE